MRLIDADALMEQLIKKKAGVANGRYTEGFNDALMRFRSMVSTAAKYRTIDAAEVVRCKDCKHKETWHKNEAFGYDICGVSGLCVVEDNDFCSYGERKDNG